MSLLVCVATAVLAKFFDHAGKLLPEPRSDFSKKTVADAYSYMQQHMRAPKPPPRTLFRTLNTFLMTPPHLLPKERAPS